MSLLLSFDTLRQNKIRLHPISRHATVKEKGSDPMTLFASILFLLAIILFDEYKIHREKKRVAPESQKRIKEFNNYMERLKEIQNSK